MRLDAVIEQFREDAGASRLSKDKLMLAEACKAEIDALRRELVARFSLVPIPATPNGPVDLRTMEEVKKAHFLAVWNAFKRVDMTASVLGVCHYTVYKSLKQYGLPRPGRKPRCESSSPSPSSRSSPEPRSARA